MARLTLQSVVTELLAIPSPGERLPLDLLRRMGREVWRDLDGGDGPGIEFGVPGWGLGVAMLTIGVANWGVDWTGARWGGEVWNAPIRDGNYLRDPAGHPTQYGRHWEGPRHKSGKHFLDGGSAQPYGGLGICHLDSGGLLAAYEQWGYPLPTSPGLHVRDGKPVAFDVLRRTGNAPWRLWRDWADDLLARPEFHEWLVAYWLREFWAPSWEQTRMRGFDEDEVADMSGEQQDALRLEAMARTCINARIRNSAKGWAKQWAHLPAGEQAQRYVEAKREARGDAAAKRTERQVRYALRAAAAIEAVRVWALP